MGIIPEVQPVQGAQRLSGGLIRAGQQLAALAPVNDVVATLVYQAALPGTPRRTGALASSLTVTADNAAGSVNSRLPYAVVVHNGWRARHIRANPWLARAGQRTIPAILAKYEQYVDDTIHAIT